jgi:putative methionine-R-sulfoxide reductase with GAF domain/DNA-binding Lrp family transcriptional regulator/HAMP domain-containing protein
MKNSIKRKLQLIFLAFVAVISITVGLFFFYINRLRSYQESLSDIDKLQTLVLTARKHEHNFLTFDTRSNQFMETGVSRNLTEHGLVIEELNKLLEKLQEDQFLKRLGAGYDMEKIKTASKEYNLLFTALSKSVRERGFKDYGLEGQMREVIHQLEDESKISKVQLLQLRRHEKDFFLRKDTAYVNRLHQTATQVMNGNIAKADKEKLNFYLSKFDEIVELERQIGLDEKSGQRGQILEVTNQIDNKVETLHAQIKEYIQGVSQESQIIFSIVGVVVIVLSIVLGFAFAASLSRPIIRLGKVAESVMKEGIKEQDKQLEGIHTGDELQILAENFKYMLSQLRAQIQEIDQQNKQLRQVSQRESQRVWRSEGMFRITEILRQNTLLTTRLNEIIFSIVRHLEAYQGAIYILDEANGKQIMEMKAYFAAKQLQNQGGIKMGEGLIGEAWRKKEVLVLRDMQIPSEYNKISLGIGFASPKTLLIVPIMAEEFVLGIIEIASLRDVQDYEVDFVKRAASQMALSLLMVRVGDLNRKLVSTMQEHRLLPSPELIAGATQEEILEMLRKQT